MMSNGSVKVIRGRMFRPVTFLMEYLCLIRSVSSLSASTSSLRASILLMNSGCESLNASLLDWSAVSRTVPSAKMIRPDTSILSLFAQVPQLIPEALFMTIPPTIALFIDAGSGPNFLPKRLRYSLTFAPTTPGWSLTVCPLSGVDIPSQFFPATTSTESLTA